MLKSYELFLAALIVAGFVQAKIDKFNIYQ